MMSNIVYEMRNRSRYTLKCIYKSLESSKTQNKLA